MTTPEQLVKVWESWDFRPGAEETAQTMEYACSQVAKDLGVSVNILRADLAHLHREGLSIPEAVEAVFQEGWYAAKA